MKTQGVRQRRQMNDYMFRSFAISNIPFAKSLYPNGLIPKQYDNNK